MLYRDIIRGFSTCSTCIQRHYEGISTCALYRDIREFWTCAIQRPYQGDQYLYYTETLSGGSVPVLYRDIIRGFSTYILQRHQEVQSLCYIETLSGGFVPVL